MGTPEQPRGTKPFRQWDEKGNLSVGMNRDLDAHPPRVSMNSYGELANLWPTATVDTLLTAWGYNREPSKGWLEIDIVLWHHIDSLFSLFTEYKRGGPAPLKNQARLALDDYNSSKLNWSDKLRKQLFNEKETEKVDNSRWMAEYTMKWLDAGLRLLEVSGGRR